MRATVTGLLVFSVILGAGRMGYAKCADDDPDGSKTLAARQQVATECSCDLNNPPATNHGAYVKCAANIANTRASLDSSDPNFLPKTCKSAVKKCAAHSICGKPGFVTCCITNDKGTKCKTKKDEMHCTDKGGVVSGNGTTGCTSCCDACSAPQSGPSCASPSGAFLN
jgi:hypothetical protein